MIKNRFKAVADHNRSQTWTIVDTVTGAVVAADRFGWDAREWAAHMNADVRAGKPTAFGPKGEVAL